MFENIGLKVTNFAVGMPTLDYLCHCVPTCGKEGAYYRLAGDGVPEELAAADGHGASHEQGHRPLVKQLTGGEGGRGGQKDLQKGNFYGLKKIKCCEGRKELVHTTV
jgi:hypothetical protein